jgi:hypothetical protein
LQEDEVKTAVRDYLEANGYEVEVMWGRDRGIDIDARGPGGRIIAEAKGDAPTPQMQGNYFLGALGELLQRMSEPDAAYALALPDTPRFQGLVSRLPRLAKERLHLVVFFVSRSGSTYDVRSEETSQAT